MGGWRRSISTPTPRSSSDNRGGAGAHDLHRARAHDYHEARAVTDGGRRFPDRPIVAVGALIFRGEQVLLVRRGQPPARGDWSIPGGVVELGETLIEALVREVAEETGLTVAVGPVVGAVDRIHRDATGRVEFHYVIADFLCREPARTASGLRLDPVAQSDVDAVRWVAPAALASYGVHDDLVRIIERARRLADGDEAEPRAD